MMLKYTLEQITDRLTCGEGLHWDNTRKCMFFCDINNSVVLKYTPKTKELHKAKVDAPFVSFIIPVKGSKDKFLVGVGRSIAIMKWDGMNPAVKASELQILHTVEESKPKNRFNDGKCDVNGRLLTGTMGSLVKGVWEDKQGSFYSIEKDKKPKSLLQEVGISNGLCWSLDNKILYYIDSLRFTVDAFDYVPDTGELQNRRVVFDLVKNGVEGTPDGMTTDSQGNLWVALYGGYGIICINPKNQTLLHKIPVPGKYITCIQFGGEQLQDMYVTSATIETDPAEIKISPYLGGTFIITGLGVKGVESYSANF